MQALKTPHGNRYPWEEWFKRARDKPLKLYRGKHYCGFDSSFYRIVHRNAVKHGLRASCSVGEGCVTFTVRRKK